MAVLIWGVFLFHEAISMVMRHTEQPESLSVVQICKCERERLQELLLCRMVVCEVAHMHVYITMLASSTHIYQCMYICLA